MAVTAGEIVKQLEKLGQPSYKKILLAHGATEPVLGVKIEELKKIQKKVKDDHDLALALYDTGIYDAQYLAGLMADDDRMTKRDLQRWATKSNSSGISEYTVAWVAADGPLGWEMGLEWIESPKELVAAAGWATLGGVCSVTDDDELDLAALKKLLQRVEKTIHKQPNRVRATMNNFVIQVGAYVAPLTAVAVATGKAIGPVFVDVGGTACKTPFSPESIAKIEKRGIIGKKRKTTKC